MNGKLAVTLNDGDYMNHSYDPTVGRLPDWDESTEIDDNYALRDIQKGEELTMDYRIFVFFLRFARSMASQLIGPFAHKGFVDELQLFITLC